MTFKYETRTMALAIVPASNSSIIDERATFVTIVDQGGGEYLEVSQLGTGSSGTITIDDAEWPELQAAITRMLAECRDGVDLMPSAHNGSDLEET